MFEKIRSRTKPVEQAMDYEVERFLDPKRTYMHKAERYTIFKAYLSERQDEEINLTEIADDMKISTAQASRIIADLIANKEVIRHGGKNHYSYTVTTPEVRTRAPRQRKSEVKEKVLNYLTRNQEKFITQEEVARGSGVTQPQVSRALRDLVKEGIIVKSEPAHLGTRYQVNDSPNAHLQTDEESRVSNSEEQQRLNQELYQAINSLVWQFIRQTRSTDVLAFLTWLEMGMSPKE